MSTIAGMAGGAARALEEIIGEQMLRAQMAQREREALAQREMERQRLAESQRQFDVRTEGDERKRRDTNNTRGIELMRIDKGDMDTEAAISSLPAHLKPIAGLLKIGAVGKLGTEDLEDPAVRSQREADALKADEARQIRIRNATRPPQAPREKKQSWVIRGDSTTPIPIEEGTAQPGDRPYDPVAARSSKPVNDTEAVDTAREAKRIASALVNHKGLGGAFGVFDSMMPTMRQDTADAEQLRDSLRDLLTLENMGKMKGVLSDSDMKVLRNASTTLNARMSDGAARTELNRIIEVMGKVAGDEAPPANDRAAELIKKYGGGGG